MPHPEDALEAFYGVGPEELEVLVDNLFERLGLPRPNALAPERIPTIGTAGDLADYLERRRAELGEVGPAAKGGSGGACSKLRPRLSEQGIYGHGEGDSKASHSISI